MTSLKITLIVAAAENNIIGKDNKMPWHLPQDFKYFKQQTLEHSIVMGRKTFESIGKALPERRNIVLTRDLNYSAEEIDVANSIDELLNYCRDEREIFIIGGAQLYRQFMPLANRILLTRVHTVADGDTAFPEIPTDGWKCVRQDPQYKDDKHAFDYTFEEWEKI